MKKKIEIGLGGMADYYEKISKLFERSKFGLTLAISGCEGSGKTSFVKKFCKSLQNEKMFSYKYLTGQKIWSLAEDENFDEISQIFLNSFGKGNSVLVIDDFDLIGKISAEEREEQELKDDVNDNKNDENDGLFFIKTKLLFVVRKILDIISCMRYESMQKDVKKNKIFVVFVCGDINDIDNSLRGTGRIQQEIKFSIPSLSQRRDILNVLLTNFNFSKKDEKDNIIEKISNLTPNFTGKDLKRLVRITYFNVIKGNSCSFTLKDFEVCLKGFKASQLMNLRVINPKDNYVNWNSIGGYSKVKKRCKEIIYGPLEKYKVYKKLGLPICSGLLLHGPSGCGKTMIVKALSSFMKMNYVEVKCSEIFSMYTGETEKTIRSLFQKARELSPCVLVFDEIDALCSSRNEEFSSTDSGSSRRALSQLLNELDGVQSREQVFIIGCTNMMKLIDSAILRQGRLDHLIHVPLPNDIDRFEILSVIIKRNGIPIKNDVNLKEIAFSHTKGFSGADLDSLCREAALCALRKNMNSSFVNFDDFLLAKKNIPNFLLKK